MAQMQFLAESRRPAPRRGWLLGLVLLAGLAECQPRSGPAEGTALPLPTGHYAGGLQVPGRPELRATLELRHPRPGHYEAELLLPRQPALSFVADTLTFQHDTLRLARPGRAGQILTLGRQGDFWRGTLGLDSVRYPLLLVRRGPPAPAAYRVRRDGLAGTGGPVLLFSPADESRPGPALALLPNPLPTANGPAWADALARQGFMVLLLPPADTLNALALRHALALLRRTAGVDTARIGAWLTGTRAAGLPPQAGRLTFVVAQNIPTPPLAARRAWRALAQQGRLLAVYDQDQPKALAAAMRAVLGAHSVRRGADSVLITQVSSWLRAH
ncbi:hypothetical protein [Hymenobacter psoromatis]|uniref:hypothetical protein n=1 Tax=Hymenobacter psoromatis TaxID=1484116 RepID=UPI001CBFA3B8|nr:hypothetical protein [Hymenobacter psoromatis]